MERLRSQASWLIGRVNVRSHTLVYEAFTAAGSRPYHYRILAALDEAGPSSQTQIARLAELDHSDVTSSLDELCAARFARRDPDPTDRRRNRVSLTRSGRAELRRLDAVRDEVQQHLLAPLSAGERKTIVDLMSKLAQG